MTAWPSLLFSRLRNFVTCSIGAFDSATSCPEEFFFAFIPQMIIPPPEFAKPERHSDKFFLSNSLF
jgi:hypothetical protein